MEVNLGGDRLGSGNKNNLELHHYFRSTHNLSQKCTTSMASGVLYPFLCIPAMRGDNFNINLEAACRTIPTKGPLFGSYKMQLDVFSCPVRLYQAILHNNPVRIGMNMNQVKFPILQLTSAIQSGTSIESRLKGGKIHNSSLLKYLGLSGLGKSDDTTGTKELNRQINAIPALAYYDIFKQYYANKQEENAYVIGVQSGEFLPYFIQSILINENGTYTQDQASYEIKPNSYVANSVTSFSVFFEKGIVLDDIPAAFNITTLDNNAEEMDSMTIDDWETAGYVEYSVYETSTQIRLNIRFLTGDYKGDYEDFTTFGFMKAVSAEGNNELKIKPFKLVNIDDMRMKLLSYNNIGNHFTLLDDNDADGVWGGTSGTDQTGLPYSTLFTHDTNGFLHNQYPMNGLCLKTYQSDIYNNWLDSTLVDGNNGIAALTAVSTSGGSFTMDALNLAEKLYDLYNRILVSGGTYEDWQNVVYTQMPRMQIEQPIYYGGMSSEVVFEEIVQTAPASVDGEQTVLGDLGGRGTLIKRKGGNVNIKCTEACFIIGIVSLTPRIMYTQGNEFYLTDLLSMDDFHKPALDGIGFQNLVGERLAWWDTTIPYTSYGDTITRSVIGKIPAWLEYMTAVDKAYGDFADDDTEQGKNFMVLSRRYEPTNLGAIKDATTYIDPTKFNYAFAYTELQAQNFWVQINSNIIARRLMSAKQIPNL